MSATITMMRPHNPVRPRLIQLGHNCVRALVSTRLQESSKISKFDQDDRMMLQGQSIPNDELE